MARVLFFFLVWVWMGSCTQRPSSKSHPSPALKIGIVTDVQYCECDPAEGRYYRESLSKLANAVTRLAENDAREIISLGDLIEEDRKNFPPLLALFERSQLRVHHVLGNHDFEISDTLKDSLPHFLNMPARYYSLEKKNWMLVFLDGNDLSFYAGPSSPEKIRERDILFSSLQKDSLPQAKTWNGGISREQRDWLEQILEKARKTGKKVLLFSHFPVYPPNPHNLWNAEEILPLLQQYPEVVAHISGHDHEGFYRKKRNTHFLGLKALVNTPDSTAFALLNIFEDSLVVRGFGREPSRTLKF